LATKITMAQYGTKHGHAAGKARSMLTNPDVTLAGIFEPDPAARAEAAAQPAYAGVAWYGSEAELLSDARVAAIAIEGRNDESLAMARAAITAGKPIWYDKPGGDNWPEFWELVAAARARGLLIQMGYMFRYNAGFQQIATWARTGFLGEVFSVRAHMSTNLTVPAREVISRHPGGIFYDLAGHMLDQVVWLLGRPVRVQAVLRNDHTAAVQRFADNTLGVLEFPRALAFVDIAAMEARPMARRFEVYGTKGTAILEPFEPEVTLTLILEQAQGGYVAGRQVVPLAPQPRQTQYDRELVAFLAALRGEQPPDRSLDHELLVQETLLRVTGGIPGAG
jgi:predicted dehydrogenase